MTMKQFHILLLVMVPEGSLNADNVSGYLLEISPSSNDMSLSDLNGLKLVVDGIEFFKHVFSWKTSI